MARSSVKINQRELMAQLSASEPVLKRVMDEVMEKAFFKPAVEEMKKEFEAHLITQEIRGGLSSPNISNTLEAPFREEEGDSVANLWSFIGFDAAQGSPAEQLAPITQRLDPRHPEGPRFVYVGRSRSKIEYRYQILAPNENAIYGETPLPWLQGISWAKRIEQGIPGIGKYLNVLNRPSSRSGGGVQIDAQLRTGRFKPTSYLTGIFNNFLRNAVGRKPNRRSV